MLRIAATSALVMSSMAQLVLAQSGSGSGASSKFADCFCYNSQTQTFCHGSDWYNSQACQDWLVDDYNWIAAIIGLGFVMMFAPFVFLCSRFCCQCCGGRHSTRGCCCSDRSSATTFPGYTNRSIAMTRFAFLLAFVLAVLASLLTVSANKNLHGTINSSISQAKTSAQQMKQYGNAMGTFNQYLSTQPAYLPTTLNAVPAVDMRAVKKISDTLDTVHDIENNNGYGRTHLTFSLSMWALIVPVIALIPMACSWKASMNVFFVIHCLIAMILVVAVAPLGALAEVATESCNNWNSVVQPFVQGGLASIGVSNTYTNTNTVQQAITAIFQAGTQAGSAGSASSATGSSGGGGNVAPSFCNDFASVCVAIGGCAWTPCSMNGNGNYGCNGAPASSPSTSFPYAQSFDVLVNSKCPQGISIATAASTNMKAQSVMTFLQNVGAVMDLPLTEIANNLVLQSEISVCYGDHYLGIRKHAQNVAIGMAMQYLVSLLVLITVFLGIKRFAKWNSYNPYAEYMALEAAPVITAIVVEINHDAPWSPTPNGYATTPTGGYAIQNDVC